MTTVRRARGAHTSINITADVRTVCASAHRSVEPDVGAPQKAARQAAPTAQKRGKVPARARITRGAVAGSAVAAPLFPPRPRTAVLSASLPGRRRHLVRLPPISVAAGLLFALPASAGELQDAVRVSFAFLGLVVIVILGVAVRRAIDAWDRRRENRRLTMDGQILRELNRKRTTTRCRG